MPVTNLSLLRPDAGQRVGFQSTTLSIDVLGRFICNTLDESIDGERESWPFDTTADFDAIVVGSGMYGAYCAARLWRNGAKVLVLEAGPFFISEHYQNLSNIGLGTGGGVDARPGFNPDADRVVDQVWGMPWRGNQLFARQAFCVGGKSLFWGGWSPRLTDDVLDTALRGGPGWPPAAAAYLKTYYPRTELQLGVTELVVRKAGEPAEPEVGTDLFNDPIKNQLTKTLKPRLEALVGPVSVRVGASTVESTISAVEPAPIAIQADPPASGLFSFDKFASLPVLVESIREDYGRSGGQDQLRRLFVVPNVRVLKLLTGATDGLHVTALDVWDGERRRPINVPNGCQVVLALGAIESTRLALDSFVGIAPLNQLMGRNLMAHLRNNASVRIRRTALGLDKAQILQTAAFHIAGKASTGGRYHLQFYAGFQPGPNAEAVLYRMLPDTDSAQAQLANQDDEWVAITFRGIGEMRGRSDLAPGDNRASYINLSQELDQFGQTRAWVQYEQQTDDRVLFDEMDQAPFDLLRRLAGSDADIEYWDQAEQRFSSTNPYAHGQPRYGKLKEEGGIRDALGTTYHDSGTLWMGDDPETSVTNATGRFHAVHNAFCLDQAIFPRVGSANPVLTGLTLTRRGAETIANGGLEVTEERDGSGRVSGLFHTPEADFTPLFVFDRDPLLNRDALLPRGWRHTGDGGFARFGLALETEGGIGVLYYEREEFEDFTLRLQWRAPTIRNNSGVHVRLPPRHLADPSKLIKTGYEVQIDNTGERAGEQKGFPFPTEFFNVYHQTGAVYPVHPVDGFPAFEDLPSPNGCPSLPTIPTGPLAKWNDTEILVAGNRIKVMLNGTSVLQGGVYIDQRRAYPRGLIGLQNHFKGRRVQFRHVRIKPGPPDM